MEGQHVTADQFCELLISRNRRLIRLDDPVRSIRGLYDTDSNEWYVIESSKIQALLQRHRRR